MKHRWTKDKFVDNSILIHGKSYDYSKSIYVNYHTKLEIICPIHGSFFQLPQNHIAGRGCKKCNCGNVFNTSDFITQSIKVHENRYDYGKVNYTGNRNSIEIICKLHGPFFQLANTHLKGSGCLKCGDIRSSNSHRNTTNEFIKTANKIHKNVYDYSKVNYIQTHKKVMINCKVHGNFLQTPHNHITNKQGCPECKPSTSTGEIEFLNYIKIPNTKNNRQTHIGAFKVDGIDYNTNTIYEYLGDYYHGNPEKYNQTDYNQICKKTFGELYSLTFTRFQKLKTFGYCVKYIWESDWYKFKNKNLANININTY